MNDPFLAISRLAVLVLVPAVLLVPLLLGLLARTRVGSESERFAVRARASALVLATLAALAVWLGSLLTGMLGPRIPALEWVAQLSWLLFFPLWFGFALPLLQAKDPELGPGRSAPGGTLRSASLSPRHREAPIPPGHWVAGLLVAALFTAAIAARGLWGPFADDGERGRWLVLLGFQVATVALAAALVPFAVRRGLSEPEPLDAAGSAELGELYHSHRHARARGTFWVFLVALPSAVGVLATLAAWSGPGIGAPLGPAALLAPLLAVFAGAWFGISTTARRYRIHELRARLEGRSVGGADAG